MHDPQNVSLTVPRDKPVVDRLIIRPGKEFRKRLADSIETAAGRSGGTVPMDMDETGSSCICSLPSFVLS